MTTSNKEAATLLLKNWKSLTKELSRVDAEALNLQSRKRDILTQLSALLTTLDVLKERPKQLDIPFELLYKPNATIAEIVEELLSEFGAMTRRELSEVLVKTGHLREKNARIVVSNAIKREMGKRFKEAGDGKVSLL